MNKHQTLTGAVNYGNNCYAVGSVQGIRFTAYAAGCDIVILASDFQRVQIIPGITKGNIQVGCVDCSIDTGKVQQLIGTFLAYFSANNLLAKKKREYLERVLEIEHASFTPLVFGTNGGMGTECQKFVSALATKLAEKQKEEYSIAASYKSEIIIYEPTPIIQQVSNHFSATSHGKGIIDGIGGRAKYLVRHKVMSKSSTPLIIQNSQDFANAANQLMEKTTKLDYHWVQTATISADSNVLNLSWNLEGTKLLSSGDGIQLWNYFEEPEDDLTIPEETGVSFLVGNEEKTKTAMPVHFLKFSPDGSLFASAGKDDRLVKIWHEDRKMAMDKSYPDQDILFKFIYLVHPRAVTSLSWRQTSKYMPRNAVSNMLVTSCKDNICRIWVRSILPDDGLININQLEPILNQNPKLRTHKHKLKMVQRVKHMKSYFNFKTRQASQYVEDIQETIPSLPSTLSAHDFHSFGMYGGGISPGLHFHLSASINAETDIPLVPSLNCVSSEPNFVLHWLNNKELTFTLAAEKLLEEISKKALLNDQSIVDQNNEINEDDKSLKGKKLSRSGLGKPLSRSRSDDVNCVSQNSMSSPSSSSTSIATDTSSQTQQSVLGDFLDQKIDKLVTEWCQSPDLLFSIHPVDGSFLVWYVFAHSLLLVEWLDEYSPSSFRQAQVSFSSRIPNALPLGDAITMDPVLCLYNPLCYFDIKTVIRVSEEQQDIENEKLVNHRSMNNPIICMVSKHLNGTLNLWHITFNEDSKYTQVLSIGHFSRMCGHRFRVNDITCHPVLPLLLTTSHHNSFKSNDDSELSESDLNGFCSELILWKVDPVGPLSKSGGVTELARITSPKTSAFSNVAWIPTLLPSTTLGSISNSPSACFVASDGHCLRIYQAVIDSRTLLAEISNSERRDFGSVMSFASSSSVGFGMRQSSLKDTFNVVSEQSTARPGCIIQLDAISDAIHDWQDTQFLHVYQEQLITSESNNPDATGLFGPHHQPIVDLHNTSVFEQPFYLVVIEKNISAKSVLHMWKMVIASQPEIEAGRHGLSFSYVPDANFVQDSDHSNVSSRGSTPEPVSPLHNSGQAQFSPLSISTKKVCVQELALTEGIEIVHATPSAGHLSSSSIYPACFAPYLISTACSDSLVRFWKCEMAKFNNESENFQWKEWEMMTSRDGESYIDIPGQPLYVSCAYSGRIACAYKYGKSFTRSSTHNPEERFVNLCVAIYECESTGGSEWILEDTIQLKNVSLPKQIGKIDSSEIVLK
ncbi:DmX-like protein 2 [Nymphon striatum]|nr:DmX-like protein 2 [Nymphon striatum]